MFQYRTTDQEEKITFYIGKTLEWDIPKMFELITSAGNGYCTRVNLLTTEFLALARSQFLFQRNVIRPKFSGKSQLSKQKPLGIFYPWGAALTWVVPSLLLFLSYYELFLNCQTNKETSQKLALNSNYIFYSQFETKSLKTISNFFITLGAARPMIDPPENFHSQSLLSFHARCVPVKIPENIFKIINDIKKFSTEFC